MIRSGDKIAVAVSGGKDSMLLAAGLAALRRFYPEDFELCAVIIDLRFGGRDGDWTRTEEYCASIGVPVTVKRTDIGQIVFDIRREENPCSLCAKMRRGALDDAAKELGCNKVALGHHSDDAVETFLMNLFVEGRAACYSPVTYLSRKDITVIRPLSLMTESEVAGAVKRLGIPVRENPCPRDCEGQRREAAELLRKLEKEGFPGLRKRLLGALRRDHISGW